jgi:glycerol-3-phosphate dehydrogenase
LFGTTSKEVSKVEEPVQITKSEYERLISRINQLTEIINKLK